MPEFTGYFDLGYFDSDYFDALVTIELVDPILVAFAVVPPEVANLGESLSVVNLLESVEAMELS